MPQRIPPRERKDLFIAWLAIALAFTFIFITREVSIIEFLEWFSISLVTVGIGFILHEMAHKFTAIRFGYRAEFRKNTQMLLFAVILAVLTSQFLGAGFVFAAPGATVIYGGVLSREQNGRISIAGPLTNLILCIPFGMMYLSGVQGPLGVIGFLIGVVGLQVNAMIAFFNMLPVSVLDGRKILSWNPPVFAVMFLATLVIVYLSSFYTTGIIL
jgi:Zn-dependent protease